MKNLLYLTLLITFLFFGYNVFAISEQIEKAMCGREYEDDGNAYPIVQAHDSQISALTSPIDHKEKQRKIKSKVSNARKKYNKIHSKGISNLRPAFREKKVSRFDEIERVEDDNVNGFPLDSFTWKLRFPENEIITGLPEIKNEFSQILEEREAETDQNVLVRGKRVFGNGQVPLPFASKVNDSSFRLKPLTVLTGNITVATFEFRTEAAQPVNKHTIEPLLIEQITGMLPIQIQNLPENRTFLYVPSQNISNLQNQSFCQPLEHIPPPITGTNLTLNNNELTNGLLNADPNNLQLGLPNSYNVSVIGNMTSDSMQIDQERAEAKRKDLEKEYQRKNIELVKLKKYNTFLENALKQQLIKNAEGNNSFSNIMLSTMYNGSKQEQDLYNASKLSDLGVLQGFNEDDLLENDLDLHGKENLVQLNPDSNDLTAQLLESSGSLTSSATSNNISSVISDKNPSHASHIANNIEVNYNQPPIETNVLKVIDPHIIQTLKMMDNSLFSFPSAFNYEAMPVNYSVSKRTVI